MTPKSLTTAGVSIVAAAGIALYHSDKIGPEKPTLSASQQEYVSTINYFDTVTPRAAAIPGANITDLLQAKNDYIEANPNTTKYVSKTFPELTAQYERNMNSLQGGIFFTGFIGGLGLMLAGHYAAEQQRAGWRIKTESK